jgi:hypothetical protein
MTMTPDEVVKVLGEIFRQKREIEKYDTGIFANKTKQEVEALSFAISLIQNYQKLRERVNVEKIDSLIRNYAFRHECNLGNEGIILEKSICEIAQAIVTYLQQPTEH